MKMRWLTWFGVGALLTASVLVGTPSGVHAGSNCFGSASNTPDGRIKLDAGWVGIDQYADTLLTTNAIGHGEKATFAVRFKNLSGATRTIRLAVNTHDDDPGFSRPRYFVDSVKVGDDYKWAFKNVAAGKATPKIEIVVKNKDAAPGAEITTGVFGEFGGALGTCDRVEGRIVMTP